MGRQGCNPFSRRPLWRKQRRQTRDTARACCRHGSLQAGLAPSGPPTRVRGLQDPQVVLKGADQVGQVHRVPCGKVLGWGWGS